MLRHPALVFAEVGSDTKREAFLAEKNVSAVSRVDGYDGIVFGEVHDISLFGIDVALAVETFHEVAVFAELFVAIHADARHDFHVEYNVDGIGNLDADFRERRADYAHRIGNNVHRSALHLAAGDFAYQLIRLLRIHPLYDGMRHSVFFFSGADERTIFHAGYVVFCGSVQIAIGQKLFVQLDHFAAVDPHDFIGLGKLCAVFHELQYFLVFRKVGFYFDHCDISP